MEKTDHLQYIFACLATHSYLISQVKRDFNKIHQHFKLSSQDEISLRLFMNTQCERLLTSAILMEEKRWREITPIIKNITTFISKDRLRFYWIQYLTSIKAKENIPESAINEAIHFLNYLLMQYKNPSILREIIQYEIAKNTAASFNFGTHQDRIIYSLDHIKNNYSSYQAALNPSYSIVNFNFPISKIIYDLKKTNKIDTTCYRHKNKKENIIFFKNRSSKSVRTLFLNDIGHHLFSELINLKNLGHWKQSIDPVFQSKKNVCHAFIKTMIDIDLLTIEYIGDTKYVCQA